MVAIVADEFLTDDRDRKYYADHYICCPPPLFIIIITLVEVSTLKSYLYLVVKYSGLMVDSATDVLN